MNFVDDFSLNFSLTFRFPIPRHQHAACQRLTSESACLANPACRPNRDPWYMDAIIHNNPHDGGTLLEYYGKCTFEEHAKNNITSTSCGMAQMDYCSNAEGQQSSDVQ